MDGDRTQTARTLRIAAALAAFAGGAGLLLTLGHSQRAIADEPPAPAISEALALPTIGQQTVVVGLERVVPVLALEKAADSLAAKRGEALEGALAEATGEVVAAYKARFDYALTTDEGLSPAGEVARALVAKGIHHGHQPSVEASKRIGEAAKALAPPPEAPLEVEITAEQLREAWAASAGAEDRMAAISTWLAEQVESFEKAAQRRVARVLASSKARAELEVALAEGLLALAAHVPPQPRQEALLEDDNAYISADTLWRDDPPAEPDEETAKGMLEASFEGPEALKAWFEERLPRPIQYGRLVEAHERYAAICAAGGWPQIDPPKESRGENWSDAAKIKTLQSRLKIEGFYEGEPSGVFDETMSEAVKAYQAARNLKVNGLFNTSVSRELNVTCERRLDVIRLNIERWRHSARDKHDTYVEVNLAGFEMRYFRDGKFRAQQRTVVGSNRWYWETEKKRRRYRNATPILTETIAKVILNPSWTVPRRIYLNEMKPKIEKNPNWLEEEGYVTRETSNGFQMIVQPPGPNNALGDVKLVFPNSESIFLHDTNRRGFFNYPRRALSHGCVRVDNALDVARAILDDDAVAAGERKPVGLKSIAKGNKTYVFVLEEPIPIFLEYYTVSVTDSGVVRFHPDIYDYDHETLDGPLTRRKKGKTH